MIAKLEVRLRPVCTATDISWNIEILHVTSLATIVTESEQPRQ